MKKNRLIFQIFLPTLLSFATILFANISFAGIVDEILPGHWYEVPNSNMDAVDPCPIQNCSYSGSDGVYGVIDAWNGGAYDSVRSNLLVWGGGHGNYGGNEIYAFNVNDLTWSLLSTPSDPASINLPYAPDRQPTSRHTYNYIQYVPSIDRFCSFGGSVLWGNGQTGSSSTDCFNSDTGLWERKTNSRDGIGTISGYDPVTDKMWLHDAGSGSFLSEYDFATDTWTPRGDQWTEPGWFDYYYTAAVDPNRRVFVAVGNGKTIYWDLTQSGYISHQILATTGDTEIESAQAAGFSYDPIIKKFVSWSGGSDIFTLDFDTGVWTRISPAATNTVTPTSATPNGTNGRFRYMPEKNAYIVVNSTDENVFIYRLSEGIGSADIVTTTLENLTGNTVNNAVTTFGHAFKQGDVASATVLAARLSDGTNVPLQVNAKATYSDGSLRHGIITANIPTLASSGDTLTLSTNGKAPAGNEVSVSDILASNFDAQISLNVDGTTYSASARDLLQNTTVNTWFSGVLASEYLVSAAVKNSDGNEHPQLTAYFHIRAYAGLNQVRVDVILENNWSFVAGPGNLNISNATINIGGIEMFNESFTHYHHSRWHKQFWWGGDTSIYVKHDHDYLQATKAIPKYEDLTPSEGFLNGVRQSILPMQNGDQTERMSDTGFQPSIGPLAKWDAIYAISADRRAFHYMLANADAGGSYSIHYRDKDTSYPINIDDYPEASLDDPNGSNPSWPVISGGSPYLADQGHQPSIGFLPYIVTGDYYYLEEAQFWSAYNLISTNAAYRNYADGWWYNGSLRGQAWSYRSLAQVAYITPNDHAMKTYFNNKLQSNLDRDYQRHVIPEGPYHNNLGAMYMAEGNEQYRFYDYFMSWVVQYMVDLGFDQAVGFRDYKLQFPIGLMGINTGEYCFQVAAQYTWKVGPIGTEVFYNDFNEVYTNMYPQLTGIQCGSQAMADALGVSLNEITAEQFSTGYYFANLQPALAAAADSGLPGGTDAWSRAHLSGIHPDYSDEPIWAVIPRSSPSIVSTNFSADSSSILLGNSVTLSWVSSNANICLGSGAWSGGKALSGSEIVSPTSDSTYILECTGQTGTSRSSLTIRVSSITDLIFSNSFDPSTDLLNENFSSYAIDANPNDWVDTGVNNSLQEDNSLFKIYDVNGNMAFGTNNINLTNIHSHYVGSGSNNWSNYKYSGRMRIGGANDNIGVTFYSDFPNSNRYYRLRREGSTEFYIAPHGTNCTGDTQTGVIPIIDNWYDFLVEVQNVGSSINVKAKVWLSGTAEPATWQADCNDSSATRLLNGTVGVWGVVSGNDSGTKLWDNLKVVPLL